ncbi:MAG: S-layer homology domain-containing protein [Clostridia bacterium]|nr:S-layer homology domain-containing protein [Clostridia bacterium]
MKKLISLILSAVILLSTAITVNAAKFSDVKSSDWYYSSVDYVSGKGIMQGTSNTKFSPKASLTRAMGVTLLYRVADSPSVSDVSLPFTDVEKGQWYTDAVKWAYKNGIVKGKSDTFFDTNGDITRAEFATILNRYADSKHYIFPDIRYGDFVDSDNIPFWAYASVATMYRAEIIKGKNGGVFDPFAKITRAEAATIIERFVKCPKDKIENPIYDPIITDAIPTTGKIVIKEKKYDYQGTNVMILNVENQTSKHLNITIKAKFHDANGKLITAKNHYVEGFPANYRNYVVFNPGIKFETFTYEVETSNYKGPAYLQYFTCGTTAEVTVQEDVHDLNQGRVPRAQLNMSFRVLSSFSGYMYYSAQFVLFDKNGEIFWIDTGDNGFKIGTYPYKSTGYRSRYITYDVKYTDFIMPEVLKDGCTAVVGICKASERINDISEVP